MRLTKKAHKRVNSLLEVCNQFSGEYVPSNHGSGSWATTYSNDFILAATEIFSTLQRQGADDPILELSNIFTSKDIKSCRGASMNYQRTKYLYYKHLKHNLQHFKDKALTPVQSCQYCKKKTKDNIQHVSHVHPEHWESYQTLAKVKAYLGGRERCSLCGNFLTSLTEHSSICKGKLQS